jgi:glycosyltransferase involved in cell wall biosynthesis
MTRPFISILIPCRNEEVFISKCLDSLLSNDYSKDRIEFLIIDGLSTDNTVDIVKGYLNKFPFINIFQNQKKVFPAAVNIGIKESRGDFIFIAGAHATYAPDYFSKCVENSLKYNADNVGGVLQTVPLDHNLAGELISFVLSNSFGVGNSKFRTGSFDIMEVDTVFGGCYKKEVFQKYGMFIESLTSTSDFEFNKRIKQRGAKILLVPEIKITYFTRSTIRKFIKNNIRNGFWAIYPIALTKGIPVSLRHFIPLIFLFSIIFFLVSSLKWSFFIKVLLVLLILYLLCSIYFSIRSISKKYHLIPFLPVLFFILHITYGLGSLWGAIRVIIFKMKNLRNKS